METEREALIRSRINHIGLDSFPDNTDVEWKVLSIAHSGPYSFAEAEAVPANVGYPKFTFVLNFPAGGADPLVAGCYCFDRGKWRLLFTDPKVSGDWKKLFPPKPT